MGRHRKKVNSRIRRSSVIALAGLVPAGAVTAAYAATSGGEPQAVAVHEAADATELGAATPTPEADAASGTVDTEPAAASAEPAAETAAPAKPALAPVQATPPLPKSLKEGALGIPNINVDAYQNAERILAVEKPGCHMYWTLLAGIGRVESTHANDGKADDKGNLLDPVLGPLLDGHLAGNNVIPDTDGGALDGDPNYDRAVGPMQFLPATWKKYAEDGNGDGVADPQNLYDAVLTTGNYLCDGGLDMRDIGQATKGILRYNNSMAYVANVLAWSAGYSTGIVPGPADLPRIH